MKNIAKNYLQLTIHQTKIISQSYLDTTYTLKLKILDQSVISGKISGKFFDYNKSFFFDVPANTLFTSLELTTNIKSFLFFDTEIGKLSLNVNLSKLLDKSEWYTVKNNNDEIIIMVLLSFSYDNSSSQEESPIKKPSKNSDNISCDKIKFQLNKSIVSNTIDDLHDRNNQNNSHIINISHLDLNNISHISKINNNTNSNKKTHTNHAHSNGYLNVPNDISKISMFTINNHQYNNSNVCSELKRNSKAEGSEYISTLDSILEADEENANRLSQENCSEIKKKFITKYNNLKEKKEKLNKFIEDLRIAKDKLRQKENLIKKERDLYESHIKQLTIEKQQYFQNNQILQNKMKRLYDTKEEHQTIFNYDKEMFYNLNFLINVPSNIDDKIQELNQNYAFYSNQRYNKHKAHICENNKENDSNKQFSITFPANSQEIKGKQYRDNIISSHVTLNTNTSTDKECENSVVKSSINNNNNNNKKNENNRFHPPKAKINLHVEEINIKLKSNVQILENSFSKNVAVDVKPSKERFISGSAEKVKKTAETIKIPLQINLVQKDSKNEIQAKKGINGTLNKKLFKTNESANNNSILKLINANSSNGNKAKKKQK